MHGQKAWQKVALALMITAMPARPVPINGSVLAWALQEANRDVEGLAAELKVAPATVEAWVNGDSTPSTTDFRKLAKALHRPTSLFLLPTAPVGSNLPVSFRAAPMVTGHELSQKEADAVRQARRVQRLTAWLRERLDVPAVSLPRVQNTTPAQDAARNIRLFLNWTLDRQTAATSPTAVTRDLRKAIEDIGVIVMQFSLGEKGCRGFSLNGSTTPLIAANSAYITQARAYSYVHELGHIVRRTDAMCVGQLDAGLERWCEEFAAAFLLPQSDLLTYVNSYVGRGQQVTEPDEITRIANQFKVSRLATATALQQLGRASQTLWLDIKRQSEIRRKGGGRGSEPQTSPVIRLREWGRTPTRLLLDAEEQGSLTRADIQEYLRLSAGQLAEVRQRLDQQVTED